MLKERKSRIFDSNLGCQSARLLAKLTVSEGVFFVFSHPKNKTMKGQKPELNAASVGEGVASSAASGLTKVQPSGGMPRIGIGGQSPDFNPGMSMSETVGINPGMDTPTNLHEGGHDMTPEMGKKKKFDWQKALKDGAQGYADSQQGQEDPMALLNRMQSNEQSYLNPKTY